MTEMTKKHRDEVTKIIMNASSRIAEADGCTNATPQVVDEAAEEIQGVIDREHLTRMAWHRISSNDPFQCLVGALVDQELLTPDVLLGAYAGALCSQRAIDDVTVRQDTNLTRIDWVAICCALKESREEARKEQRIQPRTIVERPFEECATREQCDGVPF